MPIGPNAKINRFHNISVSKCGSNLVGLISAEYSLSRNINNLYKTGSSIPVASYGDMPDVEVSYTGHASSMGSFDVSEANTFNTITIQGGDGGVSASLAILSSFKYNFQIDGPFTITKSYRGYAKPTASGGGGSAPGSVTVLKRQDYSGNLPNGIDGNFLQSITASIDIQRQTIGEFASRKPYASVVSYPLVKSITYEVIASSMDSIVISDLYTACQNPDSSTYNASISACGVSFSISKAYVTSIQYGGGEATRGSSPQTISITYSSYEDISGLKPVIYFDDNGC